MTTTEGKKLNKKKVAACLADPALERNSITTLFFFGVLFLTGSHFLSLSYL